MKYDFRKDGVFFFETDELFNDSVLARIANTIGVRSGQLIVEAKDHHEALEKFFGKDWENLPGHECPDMRELQNGWYSDRYEIVPQHLW